MYIILNSKKKLLAYIITDINKFIWSYQFWWFRQKQKYKKPQKIITQLIPTKNGDAFGRSMKVIFSTKNHWLLTEKSFRNNIIPNWNQIVFTIFQLIWKQTDVRLVPNQSEDGKYNLISVWFKKILKRFLSIDVLSWETHTNHYKIIHY